MDDLLQDFIAETREMLDALGGEIVAWEASPSDRARLDAIFRFVHTVKGNCGFFDLPRLEALSHAAEDALADVRAGRREPDGRLVSAVLAVIDRIGEMVCALESGAAIADGDDAPLVQALQPRSEDLEPSAAAASPALGKTQPLRTIRLSVDLLDRMMSGVSDLVLARNELARSLRESPCDASIGAAFERVSGNIAEMREAITRTRMQRVENLFTAIPRMVRDLAADLGKQIVVDVDGGDVELDREMIEMIRDPLTHIIRNAVDHGIEPVEARRAAGKREHGLLKVCARQSGNQILIEVSDDGRGINLARLVEKSVVAGVWSAEAAEKLTDAQKMALVFEPGLSTASAVTAISGRGVGMDVVRANVERIGGVVDIDSRYGVFTKLTLRVPLTLTIIPALTVSVGDQTFAIPRSAIEEIVRIGGETVRIETVGEAEIAQIRGRRVAKLRLEKVLGLAETATATPTLVVLKPAGGDVFALAVDRVHDHEELVVKPAAPAIMATGLYAGTTLADSGKPVLLLDAAGLARAGGVELEAARLGGDDSVAPETRTAVQAMLFRGVDGAKRAIRLAVVERIEEVPASAVGMAAGSLHVTLGDRIVDLVGCNGVPKLEKLRIVRMNDGLRELAYGFAEVIDIVGLDQPVVPALIPGPIAGVTLIGGEQVEVVDPHWLFAQSARRPAASVGGTRPLCVIPADDAWMRSLLAPMIEAAGYRVVAGGTADEQAAASLIFVTEGSGSVAAGDRRVVRIHDNAADTTSGIYRYDSAALLDRLGAAGGRT